MVRRLASIRACCSEVTGSDAIDDKRLVGRTIPVLDEDMDGLAGMNVLDDSTPDSDDDAGADS